MAMLANGKHNEPRLPVGKVLPPAHLLPSQKVEFPIAPVMPGALLLFRMLVSNQIADLAAIADAIRSDLGLTVHVLRLAAEEGFGQDSGLIDLDEIVVLLGLDKLRALSEDASVLSIHPKGNAGLQTCERFSMHARLTALIAEELAGETARVRQEDAYVAGLLRHIGALPFVLGWSLPELENADTGEIGYYIAKSWHLPEALLDVIRGNREACAESSLALFDLVSTADKHAFRLAVGYNF